MYILVLCGPTCNNHTYICNVNHPAVHECVRTPCIVSLHALQQQRSITSDRNELNTSWAALDKCIRRYNRFSVGSHGIAIEAPILEHIQHDSHDSRRSILKKESHHRAYDYRWAAFDCR